MYSLASNDLVNQHPTEPGNSHLLLGPWTKRRCQGPRLTGVLSPRQSLVRIHGAANDSAGTTRRRSLLHEFGEVEVFPGRLLVALRGLLDAEGGVLVGHDVVLVFGVNGLVVRGHVDLVVGQLVLAEVLEEVGVAWPLHVDVCVASVFILERGDKRC